MADFLEDTKVKDINFKDNLGLNQFLLSSVSRVLALQTCDSKLELVRVFKLLQQLRETDKFSEYSVYLGAENVSILNWTALKNLLNADDGAESKLPNLTIVDVLNYKTVHQEHKVTLRKLFECSSKTVVKKVILIYSIDHICFKCASFVKDYPLKFLLEKKVDDICFEDLVEKTQQQLLCQPSICFQGNSMSLKEFISLDDISNEKLNNIITSTVLKHIMFYPKIGSLFTICDNNTDISDVDFYIQRRFHNKFVIFRRIKKLLTGKANIPDAFIFCGIKDRQELVDVLKVPIKDVPKILNRENIAVTQNLEEARLLFDGETSSRSIHLLKHEGNGLFTWISSKGSLDKLRRFAVVNHSLTLTLSDLLKKKAVILSGPSGIGKTATLAMLSVYLESSWIINIDLSNRQELIEQLPEQIDQQNVIKFLSSRMEPHFLITGLLNHYLFNISNLPVYILFDGFDGVAENLDYKSYRAVIELVTFLKEKSQAYIWITVRPENSVDVENALSEFSTHFDKLSSQEQQNILYNFCHSKFITGLETKGDALTLHIEEFYKSHKTILRKAPSFLGVPLILKVLSNMIQPSFGTSDYKAVHYENFYDLFSKFVESKIERYMQKYFSNNNHKEEIKAWLNAIHAVGAFRLLSPELDELLGGQKNIVLHVDICQAGFVSSTKDNSFKFIHQTYAEYFATNMFYKWMLEPGSCPMEKFLCMKIFLEPQYKIVRYFLNYRIKQHPLPAMPKHVIERLLALWNKEKGNFFDKEGRTALHVLINEELSDIIHWFFPKDFIVHILPSFSTRYDVFSPQVFPKIETYSWAPKLTKDDLYKKLFCAIRNHKLDDVHNLLSSVEDFALRSYISTSNGRSALHLAASLGFNDVIECLLENSIPVDILDTTHGTALQCAGSKGHLDVVKFLKTKGADLNIRDKHCKTVLNHCAEKGHLDAIKFLIEEDTVDKEAPDRNGVSVLEQAAKSGHLDIVQLLLAKGCNINHKDHFGMSALSWSVVAGDVTMADFLMGRGADSSIVDQHGRNLVHIAVKARQWHVVEYLTLCLIDVNLPDWNNITPLERAVKFEKWDLVKHLILEGASARSSGNFNPISYAIKAKEWLIVQLMIERGGCLTGITAEEKEEVLNKLITDENTFCLFYKVIRLGNVELLKLLIQRRGLDDISKAVELDKLLAEPYEKLILKGEGVSDEMKMFVEGKLVQLRSGIGQKFRLSEENVKDRIQFICKQVQILKNTYSNDEGSREVDQKFLLRTRFIAQNITLLKRSVRKTNIPWEQMEFCLVIFMNFFLKPQHEDFVYRLVMDQQKLLNYLMNFCEQSLHDYLENRNSLPEYLEHLEADYRIMKDIYSLNRISFYIKLALSLSFENDISPFVLMRCLQVIGESFKNTTDSLNLSNDVHQYLVFSAPTNVKQIVTSLRDSLSHSHTYKPKMETEDKLKCDPEYFRTIQNDLQKIILQIDFLLYTKKKESFDIFHKKCLEKANDSEGLKGLNRYIDWDSQEQMTTEDYEINDLKVIKKLVHELKEIMQEPSEKERELLKKLLSEITNIESVIFQRLNKAKSQYFKMRSNIRSFDKVQHSQFLRTPRLNVCQEGKSGIYNDAVTILIDLLDLIQIQENSKYRFDAAPICTQLCYIMKWDAHRIKSIQEIDSSLAGKADNANQDIIDNVFINIEKGLDSEDDKNALKKNLLDKQKLHDELNWIKQNLDQALPSIEQLEVPRKEKTNLKKSLQKNNIQLINNIIGNLDDYGRLIKNCTSEKFYKVLKAFCSSMKNTNVDNAIDAFFEKEEYDFKCMFVDKLRTLTKILNENEDLSKNLALQAAVEILLLDVMEACISKGAIIEYVLSFDEFTPLLVGTALRNYLAHGTPLIDTMPFEPVKAIVSTIRILFENEKNLFVPIKESYLYSVQYPLQHLTNFLDLIKSDCENLDDLTENKEKYKNETVTLDDALLNDNWFCFQSLIPDRHNPFYEYFLKAASVGALQVTKHLTNDIILMKQSIRKNNKLLSLRKCGDISNSAIIWPAIILASKNGHEEVVQTLLDLIENKQSENNKPKIDTFVFKRVAKHLQRYDVSIDKQMFDGVSDCVVEDSLEKFVTAAFSLAAVNGHQGIVALLLKYHPYINATDRNQVSVLHLVAENGHDKVVNVLLDNQANVNAVRSDLITPLHLAAANGHSETIKVLVQYHANINARQTDGFTPLHLSATYGHAQATKVLLEHHSDVAALSEGQGTALHAAAHNNHLDVARVLLDYGANVNGFEFNDITPINLAAASGHEQLVALLLEYHACIDRFEDETTPLHLAAVCGHKEVAKLLLEGHANVEAKQNNVFTALHLASAAGQVGVVEVLLEHNADINAPDDENSTALHLASQFGHVKLVEVLLEHQANVNVASAIQITPLHLAAQHGHDEVVQFLLKYHAEVNVADNTGRTPLHLSALHGYESVTRILLDNHAIIDALSVEKATPLHFAAENGHEAVVKILLLRGANVNAKDDLLFTPLHFAAQNNHEEVAKSLIDHNADINATMLNHVTPLHTAASNGHVRLVKLLLENGADINASSVTKFTPLILSAMKGHDDVVKVLLDYNADIIDGFENVETALHYAAENGHTGIVKVLLERNVNVNATTPVQNATPLHISAQKGHEEVVRLLLQYNVDVNACTRKRETPLHLGSEQGHTGVVKTLLNFHANANAVTVDQSTPLHSAAQNGHEEIVQYLIKHEANVNATMSGLVTPLHLAAQGGHEAIVKALLAHEADVNVADINRVTALHAASQTGHENIVTLLLSHRANVNSITANLATPLHASASQGYENVVKILLENQANVNAAMDEGATALHYAAKKGHEGIVRILLTNGADVNAIKTDQSTPLHLATKNGHLGVVKILLESHADVNALRIRETPLHVPNDDSLLSQMAATFLRNDMTYIKKETALTIATEERHQDIISTLLDYGAIPALEYRKN